MQNNLQYKMSYTILFYDIISLEDALQDIEGNTRSVEVVTKNPADGKPHLTKVYFSSPSEVK